MADSENRSSSSVNTVPASTSEWNAEGVCNRLKITLINQKDPRSLFVRGYLRFLQQNDKLIDYMKTHYESPDLEYRVKQACYTFALCNWEHIVHCDSVQYLQVTDAIKMKRELQKTFADSFFKEFFHSEEEFKIIDSKKGVGLSDEERKIKSIVMETCMLIFGNLRLFSHQLLYLIYNKENTSERMYQDLFLAFVRLFGLNICDTTNSPGSCFKFYHGNTVTLSEPDAVISSFMLSPKFDRKVIAVVEVKKSNSVDQDDNEPVLKKLKSVTKSVNSVAEHINSKTKGQHIGQMLAVTQSSSSVFEFDGVFGFIVQGTKVTFVSLETNTEYFENLLIKDKTQNQWPVVTYSKECDMLSKDGRQELIPIFLGLEKLLNQITTG